MSHYEFYYNFQNIQWADIIFGGNFRQYSLFSNATLFDEAPLDSNNPKRILSSAYGGYTQLSKDLFEKLRFSGSIRYDIMKDFDGHITPRVSLVYSPNENHNVRMNFQTGFRFPDMQLQFLYFDNPTGIFLGGVPSIASRYGVYNGGSWTQSSYDDFVNQGGSLNPTTGEEVSNPGNVTLVTANFPYIKPEQLSSFEVGYKGLITGGLYMDFNYYYNTYTDFLSFQKTVGKQATQHQGKQVDAGRSWLLSVNSPYTLRSNGIGIGLTYTLLENLMLTGNYNYTTFWGEQDADFLAQFNTPRNHFSIGLGSSNFKRKFGFNVNYRYQDAFLWQSPYGTATIPSYGVLDAQLNYKLPAIKTILKVGGTNLGGNDYRTNFGAPYVGQIYYVSLLFDEFLN
jgi:outer membrane receptor protein involved in Fe transport